MGDTYLKQHDAPEDIEYYLCGPPMMSKTVLDLLHSLGVEDDVMMIWWLWQLLPQFKSPSVVGFQSLRNRIAWQLRDDIKITRVHARVIVMCAFYNPLKKWGRNSMKRKERSGCSFGLKVISFNLKTYLICFLSSSRVCCISFSCFFTSSLLSATIASTKIELMKETPMIPPNIKRIQKYARTNSATTEELP